MRRLEPCAHAGGVGVERQHEPFGKRHNKDKCSGVSAVPESATANGSPDWCARIKSNCPSTNKIQSALRIAARATFNPYKTRDFLKMGVSGEFTYFAGSAVTALTRHLFKKSARHGNDFAAHIKYRKNDTPAKPVKNLARAFVGAHGKARINNLRMGKP